MSQDYKNIPLTIDIEREKLTFSKTPKLQVKSQTKRQKSFPREYTSPNFVKPFNQGVLGSCVGCSGKIIVTDEFSTEDLSALWIYNKAKKYDVWEGECVDTKTECLCKKKGWINNNELEIGDEIYTLNLTKGLMEWKEVKKVNQYKKEQRVLRYSSTTFEMITTKEHKLVVSSRSKKEKSYDLLYNDQIRSMHSFPRIADSMDLNNDKKYSDSFVALCAWIYTEGYYRVSKKGTKSFRPSKNNYIGVSQSDIKYVDEVEKTLITENIRYNTTKATCKNGTCYTFEITDNEYVCKIKDVMPHKIPTLEFILSLTKEQLFIFIEVSIKADGSYIKEDGRKERRIFFQKDEKRSDIFQIVCVLAGLNTSKRSKNRDIYSIAILHSKETEFRSLNIEEIDFSGEVWCPTTDNHTFLARREGLTFITGNSYSGTSIAGACQSLIKEGACLEKFMPYVPKENVEPEFGAEQDASKRKFTNFYAIGIDNIDQVKQMIYNGKKLWTSFIVHEGFYDVYKGYINEKDYLKGQQKGGHAVALVGWKEIRGKLFWRFQNSWGDNWGDKGFFYVSHDLYSEIVNSMYAIFRTETTDDVIDDSDDISTSKKRNAIVRILTSIVNIITKMFKR